MKKSHQTFSNFLLIFFTFFFIGGINLSYAQNLTVTTAITQVPCDHDGIVTATVTGGTAPYTYSWSTNWQSPPLITTSNVFTNYSGANYLSLTVTDANGLMGYTWQQPSGAPFTVQLDWNNCTPSHCPLNDGALAIIVTGGTAPFNYIWYNNGVVVGTTSVPNIGNLAPSINYDIEITDANGCKLFYHDFSDSLTVGSISNIQANRTMTPANCTNGTATVNPSGGVSPYTYSWYQFSPANLPLTSTSNTVSNLVFNQGYAVTITDAQGCMAADYFYPTTTVNFYANVNASPATCLNSNGAINLTIIPQTGASQAPPYAYSWSNNTVTTTPSLQNIPAGSYSCQITDANGCKATAYANVAANTPILMNLTKTPTTSCITPNGTATVAPTGGQAPYTYTWSTGATTNSISGLNVDIYYHVQVTDANGCVQQQTTQIYYQNAGTYVLNTTLDVCGAGNGTATTVITGGVAPFSYSWANGQTTATATNLFAGIHYCDITDVNGCKIKLPTPTNGNSYNVPYYSPINITGNVTNASCFYTADGSITANATGGTPPYQYNWYGTGQTGATVTGLPTGTNYVNVIDAAGCIANKNFYVGYNGYGSCTGTIKGFVYADLNMNCVQDIGENGIAGVQVYCSPYGGSQFTDASGYYEFTVPVGSYQVQHFPLAYHNAICPTGAQTVNMPAAGMVIWANFADEVIPAKDLQIYVHHTQPLRPGFLYQQIVRVKNVGTVPITSPLLHAYTDPAVSLNLPAGFVQNSPNHYTNSYTQINPNQSVSKTLNYTVPATTPLGNTLIFADSVAPTGSGELTPWNNYKYYPDVVVGSYDPNYKEVYPAGKGVEGFISPDDSILTYTVHFQNTGTYPATTVVIKDTLDSDLDWKTVSMGYATHNYTAQISIDNVLEITFDNINLADSFSNVQASMGFVSFTIKQKKNLAAGTKFTNAADIFFDFNYPIHTNMVTNTLMAATGKEKGLNDLILKVYPNPTSDKLNVEIPLEWEGKALFVRCLDLMGKEVITKLDKNQGKMTLNTANLPTGWYLLQVGDGTTLLTQKFGVVK